jgi:hypothetical protein
MQARGYEMQQIILGGMQVEFKVSRNSLNRPVAIGLKWCWHFG